MWFIIPGEAFFCCWHTQPLALLIHDIPDSYASSSKPIQVALKVYPELCNVINCPAEKTIFKAISFGIKLLMVNPKANNMPALIPAGAAPLITPAVELNKATPDRLDGCVAKYCTPIMVNFFPVGTE